MGYYSDIQTKLTNYLKGEVINWLIDISNKEVEKITSYINVNNYDEINIFIYNIVLILNNNIYILFILNKYS